MDPAPPALPDLSLILPRDAYYHLIHTLRASMPPPVTASPDDLARRDNAAIATVACLLPANAAEATLAARFVGAEAQADECLRLARDPAVSFDQALKCRAQAASMMREAKGALRVLLHLQAMRQTTEANAAAAGRAEWTEHCAAGLMAQALSPSLSPEAPPIAPEPAATASSGTLTEAETYAAIYPQRAALIRRLGRVPEDVSFGPPDDRLVRALVTGQTPALLALDRTLAP